MYGNKEDLLVIKLLKSIVFVKLKSGFLDWGNIYE